MLRELFCRREMGTTRAVALSGLLLALTTPLAWGQATTPDQPPPQSETNIGRVTTAPGEGETVVPSPTTTRAAALSIAAVHAAAASARASGAWVKLSPAPSHAAPRGM